MSKFEPPDSSMTTIPLSLSFSSNNTDLSNLSLGRNFVSPLSLITTFFIIWLTIISICLSLIPTPCNLYTSWISLTKYSLTAFGPKILKISAGEIAPSHKGVPALIKSPSCTTTCFPYGILYTISFPVDGIIEIFLIPLFISPNWTVPLTSVTTAGFAGFLASNNSATLGKPPVISLVLPISFWILTKVCPLETFWPSLTTKVALTGRIVPPDNKSPCFLDLL